MQPIVEVQGLQKFFKTPKGLLHAVEDVNMKFFPGKTMGVVGESGCGKSTLGRTIIHLQESTGGKIFFQGEDVTHVNSKKLGELRQDMQIIFQDPYSSLNPRYTVEDTLREPLILSHKYSKAEINTEVTKLMDMVGISERLRLAYPHEMDGGRRQRVGVGRALAMKPKFIVCDEPVSALDVSIQAQVINLLRDVQCEYGISYMFVTHDLSVVKFISDEISVMYLGQLVETGTTKEIFDHPLHPYTKALLSAIPVCDIHRKKNRIVIKGEIVSPINPAPGCRFAPRCAYATDECLNSQVLREIGEGHKVACCRAEALL